MIKIAVVLMNLFSFSVLADNVDDLDRCGSMADRKLKTLVQTVDFPSEYVQWGLVDRIERISFVNTTPGSLNQEYSGSYKLTYKANPVSLFKEQMIEVRFRSPFVCDDLKVSCLQVLTNKLADNVDPNLIMRNGPLFCAAQ